MSTTQDNATQKAAAMNHLLGKYFVPRVIENFANAGYPIKTAEELNHALELCAKVNLLKEAHQLPDTQSSAAPLKIAVAIATKQAERAQLLTSPAPELAPDDLSALAALATA